MVGVIHLALTVFKAFEWKSLMVVRLFTHLLIQLWLVETPVLRSLFIFQGVVSREIKCVSVSQEERNTCISEKFKCLVQL